MIVINSSTRQFNIPGADLVFGVEADSGSTVKEFQCPRYVGNHLDLTGCFVRMNYRNANGEIDEYLVENVTVDGDNVVFGWELTPKVTMYKGNVSFVMCVVGPDTKMKWHTTLGRGQVLEGLEPDNSIIEPETADVVAQLIAMVEAQTEAVEAEGNKQIKAVQTAAQTAQSDAVAQIEAKGASTLATIPGEYTATVNAVQSAANAIRGKVSGEVIRVDDVSPMEHYSIVKVICPDGTDPTTVTVRRCGKNVLEPPKVNATSNGVVFVSSDEGYIKVSGTPTGVASRQIYKGIPLLKTGYVTLSLSGNYTNIVPDFQLLDADNRILKQVQTGTSVTLNLDNYPDTAYWYIAIKRAENDIEVTGNVYLQVEPGMTATVWEKYEGETQIPSADGTVSGLTAVSPTMTLMTDKAGVNIECEYSRDTNAVIAEILEKITALVGGV